MHKKGFVYLVGAGCGSADLITVRGLRLLQSCDAVVYDDLIDPALLAQAAHAEQHPAGKRCGRHSMPQSEINSLLVRLGQSGKTVVRLKGGGPFVFGRGGEEFLALQAAGVPCEEVPGISSCIAVPAAAGIPVTHRGASRSFHVITGHTAQTGDTLPESLEALAALHGTLVFLMGLNSLEQIAARLTAAGKPPETPAAVVSGGNAPHPATVRGTLADIAEKARAARVQAPAVIVVGAAAALDQAFARRCALSVALVGRGRPHHIQWASPTGGGVEGRLVDSGRALLACLELAFSRPAPAEGRSILDTALRLPGRAGPLRHIHVTPTGLEGGAP